MPFSTLTRLTQGRLQAASGPITGRVHVDQFETVLANDPLTFSPEQPQAMEINQGMNEFEISGAGPLTLHLEDDHEG